MMPPASRRQIGIPVKDRILAKCVSVGECWEFRGSRSVTGYGRIRVDSRSGTRLAHRVMFELTVGPVPDGLDLDHLCRNRACVNPDHLEPVTHAENLRRGIGPEVRRAKAKQITHCPEGHPYDAANTRVSSNGGRGCKRCESPKYRQLRAERRRMPGSVSRAQQRMLHAVLGQLGITDRPEKLRIVGAVIWRPIESTNDLTRDEASVAIDTLQSISRRDDPRARLDELLKAVR